MYLCSNDLYKRQLFKNKFTNIIIIRLVNQHGYIQDYFTLTKGKAIVKVVPSALELFTIIFPL